MQKIDIVGIATPAAAAVKWLGGLLIVLKLGDFFLLPHQKRAFQDVIESLTLWLDYRRPLRWFDWLRSESGRFTLICICTAAVLLLGTLAYWLGFGAPPWIAPKSLRELHGFYLVLRVLLVIGYYLLAFVFPIILATLFTPSIVAWLLKGGGIRTLAVRLSMLIGIGCLVLPLYYLVSRLFLYPVVHCTPWFHYMASPLPWSAYWADALSSRSVFGLLFTDKLFTLFALLAVPIATGFLAIVASGLLAMLNVACRLMTGLAYRVAEYEKGAWAAIVLIGTVAAGLIEYYLKH